MTAPDTTRSRSDNSVRHLEGNGESTQTPECDPRLRRIVRYVSETSDSTTHKEIAAKRGWKQQTVNQLLARLGNTNFIRVIEAEDICIVLLTQIGEHLVQEEL